jgi:hypothetical protein
MPALQLSTPIVSSSEERINRSPSLDGSGPYPAIPRPQRTLQFTESSSFTLSRNECVGQEKATVGSVSQMDGG